MMKMVTTVGAFALLAAACSTGYQQPQDIVTVQYDPNSYDQSEVYRMAGAQCAAKGFREVVPYAAQPNMDAAPWGYKTFACY